MTVPTEVAFDADAVMAAVEQAIRRAWAWLEESHLEGQAYALSVYEGIEYGYICVSMLTEEGLLPVAQNYVE